MKLALITPVLALLYHENIIQRSTSQTRARSIVIREIALAETRYLAGVRDELNYSC